MLCSLVLKIQFMVFVLARGGTGREEIGGRWKEEGAKVGEIENENEKEWEREKGEAGKEGIYERRMNTYVPPCGLLQAHRGTRECRTQTEPRVAASHHPGILALGCSCKKVNTILKFPQVRQPHTDEQACRRGRRATDVCSHGLAI